jgi:hypothetical protein
MPRPLLRLSTSKTSPLKRHLSILLTVPISTPLTPRIHIPVPHLPSQPLESYRSSVPSVNSSFPRISLNNYATTAGNVAKKLKPVPPHPPNLKHQIRLAESGDDGSLLRVLSVHVFCLLAKLTEFPSPRTPLARHLANMVFARPARVMESDTVADPAATLCRRHRGERLAV